MSNSENMEENELAKEMNSKIVEYSPKKRFIRVDLLIFI